MRWPLALWNVVLTDSGTYQTKSPIRVESEAAL